MSQILEGFKSEGNVTIPHRYSIENKLIFRKKNNFLNLNIYISIMKFISRDVRIHIFIDSIIFIRNLIKMIET